MPAVAVARCIMFPPTDIFAGESATLFPVLKNIWPEQLVSNAALALVKVFQLFSVG